MIRSFGSASLVLQLLQMLLLCCFWLPRCRADATVSLQYGAVDTDAFEQEWIDDYADLQTSPACDYAGTFQLAHPMSIGKEDRYYTLGSQMLVAAHISIDAINLWPRCGVSMQNGLNYSLSLQTYGDESSENKTALIGRKIATDPRVAFLLAGYSSTLTTFLAPVAQEYQRLLITAGSSNTDVHANRSHVFGMLPGSDTFLEKALEGVSAKGAKTVAYLTEEDVNSCLGTPDLAPQYGMEFLNGTVIPEFASVEVFDAVAQHMAELDPDVMLVCIRTEFARWNQAMRKIKWSPKAQIFTIVVGTPEFEEALGTDAFYVMGVTSWDRALPPIPDGATGWTPYEFDTAFEQAAFRRPAYQHASQSSAISVLVQAIERVGDLTLPNFTERVRETIETGYFSTVYGNVSFDENGQNAVPNLLLQYDHNGTLHVLLPEDLSFTDFEMVYPMPTWDNRDCEVLSECRKTNGTCAADGTCDCLATAISQGQGESAICVLPQVESTSYLGLAVAIPIVVLVVVGAASYFYVTRVAKMYDDKLWKVDKKQLLFDDPPEVIGSGTFGLVLLGEYRGTKVAVKRALPPKQRKNNKSTKKSDGRGSQNSFDKDGNGTETNTDGKRSGLASGFVSGLSSGLGMESGEGMMPYKSKTMSSNEAASYQKLKQDFISEIRHIVQLRHPCIVTVMGAIVDPTQEPMLIMEYMEHGSLYQILHNETIVLEDEILVPMLQDISQGCRFLHADNVIHCDLKSSNVLVDSKFRAKVSDFGLSLTKDNKRATGTPFWMAPELLRGETPNTKASDIYSFGIILYECYSRKDPYEGEKTREVLAQVKDPKVNKRPPTPIGMPPQAASLMCDCLGANPGERPTFEEVDTRLKRIEIKPSEDKAHVSLFDIFPKHIAEALRDGKSVEPEHKDCVTIFFSDIVNFTTISSALAPRKVADMLDRLYSKLDALSQKHDIFKVETIGDAYMAVTNLVKDQTNDHVARIAEFAVDAVRAANETLIDTEDPDKGYLNIRVGFHSGPIVADIVGSRNPRYCLFGDSVNTASRMESNSKANKILCSDESADILRKQKCKYRTKSRGLIKVKGKGELYVHWVIPEGAESTEFSQEFVEKADTSSNEDGIVSVGVGAGGSNTKVF